jgi:hypothetical protein
MRFLSSPAAMSSQARAIERNKTKNNASEIQNKATFVIWKIIKIY